MTQAPRRHADGSLDIDHYRRRARRLRYLARRQAERRLRGAVAALGGMIWRTPRAPHVTRNASPDSTATLIIGSLEPAD